MTIDRAHIHAYYTYEFNLTRTMEKIQDRRNIQRYMDWQSRLYRHLVMEQPNRIVVYTKKD